jgi:hypothetical protein
MDSNVDNCRDMMSNEPSDSLLSYWLTAIFRGFFIIKQLMETSGDMLGNART